MIHVELTQLIDAPTAVVWDELSHLDRHVQWMGDAVAIEFRTEQHFGVGTSINCDTKVGPLRTKDVMTVTEWTDGARIGVEHRGLVDGGGAFELHAETGSSSRVVWLEGLQLPLRFGGAIGEFFAKPVMTFIWKRDLNELRLVCERRAQSETS